MYKHFDRVLKYIVPKEKSFFPLLELAAENLTEASKLLSSIIAEEDIAIRESLSIQIEDLEHKGDNISHKIYEQLNMSFITPFDREDIQKLASSLDDVMDSMNGSSQRIHLYKPKKPIAAFKEMADIIGKATAEIEIAVTGLRNAGNSKTKITQACINLNTLENRADDVYHKGISDLFEFEKDAKELIKNKAILEHLEKCTDNAEDISDTIKGILIKMS